MEVVKGEAAIETLTDLHTALVAVTTTKHIVGASTVVGRLGDHDFLVVSHCRARNMINQCVVLCHLLLKNFIRCSCLLLCACVQEKVCA